MLTTLRDLLGLGEKARAYILLRGHVYEGNYLRFAEKTARAYNFRGWLRATAREMDSYIELEVEGSKFRIQRLLEDLQRGPGTAKMRSADVQWKTYKNSYSDFRVRN